MREEKGIDNESEFDKAFSEASAEAPVATDAGGQEHGADTPETGADTGDKEVQQTPEMLIEAERKAREEAERKREEAEQRMRSWEGRLRVTNEEAKKEREAREKLERELAELKRNSDKASMDKMRAFVEDVGDDEDLSPIAELVRERIAEAEKPAEAQTEPANNADRERELLAEAHFSAIAEKHADWEQLVDEIDPWIKTLPGEKALKYAEVKARGTAGQVIDMLTDFKASKSAQKQTTTDDAEAMSAVRHRPSGARPKTRADKDDFDAAWDEAVGK